MTTRARAWPCKFCKRRYAAVRKDTRCSECSRKHRRDYTERYQKERTAKRRGDALRKTKFARKTQKQKANDTPCSAIELYRVEKLARTERGPGTLAMQVYYEAMQELRDQSIRKNRQPMGKAA